MISPKLHNLVKEFIEEFSERDLEELISSRVSSKPPSQVLTIVCDDTIHRIPPEILQGEVFVFSSGNFDTTNSATITGYLERRINALCDTLNKQTWTNIRLVYSGHAILAATAKLVVYRVTHIETDDVLYFGGQGYLEIGLRLRQLLGGAARRAD
ncbi:hypothetical protein VRZ08_09635 [Rhodopseudomonas sp. G2_2311]|uniref:hypothetical protein n=1 Tax=Rhodopseudomonas sp. G2_2311 TaxID=3114287 RepID=UPI0039C68EEA